MSKSDMPVPVPGGMALVFVDCEAVGPSCSTGFLTEFGAVVWPSRKTFHGVVHPTEKAKRNFNATSAHYVSVDMVGYQEGHRAVMDVANPKSVFASFADWLKTTCEGKRPIFMSDNPAFDWQWINDGFHEHLGSNPFGHSARRIGDFYAGLSRDFRHSSRFKRLRVTEHDHHPVHDALGNLEAFDRMLAGERG